MSKETKLHYKHGLGFTEQKYIRKKGKNAKPSKK